MGALSGKVALVTGAGSGIGRATAERFAEEGAAVCVVDRSEEAGRAVADALARSGRTATFVSADVGEPADDARMVEACVSELGGLDVAHLNAGLTCPEADIAALTDEQYRRIVRVNVDGVVFGVRAAVQAMEERGGGDVVVTSSLAGLIGFPVDPIYTLTKHAVVGLVRSLPEHLTPRGIRINTVNPGIVDTPLVGDTARDLERAGFPLLAASDVAEAVMRVLASGETGQCWPVQPGRDPEPYRFRQVPGPRTEGAAGMRPPNLAG